MDSLIVSLLQYGTTPALLVLSALVGLLLHKLDENGKKDTERAAELRKALVDLAAKTEARLTEHGERMSSIERDYLPRETHYKDLGGWRTDLLDSRREFADELREVRSAISALNTNLISTVLKGASNA